MLVLLGQNSAKCQGLLGKTQPQVRKFYSEAGEEPKWGFSKWGESFEILQYHMFEGMDIQFVFNKANICFTQVTYFWKDDAFTRATNRLKEAFVITDKSRGEWTSKSGKYPKAVKAMIGQDHLMEDRWYIKYWIANN